MKPMVPREPWNGTHWRIAAIEGALAFRTPQTPWREYEVVGWYVKVYDGRIRMTDLKCLGGPCLVRDREDGLREVDGVDWEILNDYRPLIQSPNTMQVTVVASTPIAEFEIGVLALPLRDAVLNTGDARAHARDTVALDDFAAKHGWRCGTLACVRIPGPRIPDRSWLSKPRTA